MSDWQVWSCASEGEKDVDLGTTGVGAAMAGGWMVVDSGSRAECEEGARRRNQTLQRLGLPGRFLALPPNVMPHHVAYDPKRST